MEVIQFSDQYSLAAGVLGCSAAELRRRDAAVSQPVRRWVAVDDTTAVAVVTARDRPDARVFLSFAGDACAREPLTLAAAGALGHSLHTFVNETDEIARRVLESAGFEIEVVEEAFEIRFDQVLARVQRAWIPSGFSIRAADAVDEDRLFTLDNTIRQDVPGTDGWRGDRDWFRAEFADSPPYDPAAYLVAQDDGNGELAGLIRIWRNPDGPRLGLIGVLRQYRSTPIAAALLKNALLAASQWGHETFIAETSPSNPMIYGRMKTIAAQSRGRFFQMVRHGRAAP